MPWASKGYWEVYYEISHNALAAPGAIRRLQRDPPMVPWSYRGYWEMFRVISRRPGGFRGYCKCSA